MPKTLAEPHTGQAKPVGFELFRRPFCRHSCGSAARAGPHNYTTCMLSSKPAALCRTLRFCSSAARLNYPHSIMIPTRWNDNDSFGHVNNAVYYEFMDTAVNNHLIQNGCTGARFLVSSSCNYIRSLQYPQPVEVGLRIAKLGRSSATYAIGIFGHPTPMSLVGCR